MKKILILIVALSLTLLTGCQQETTGLREDPYVGGTSAIQMNFMSEQPPVEVFDNGASFSAARGRMIRRKPTSRCYNSNCNHRTLSISRNATIPS